VLLKHEKMGPREVLETFVTLARWGNVLSKLGRKYDMSRAKQLFAEDVLEEAALQDPTLVDFINSNRKSLLSELAQRAPPSK